jgi:hypothetical protein
MNSGLKEGEANGFQGRYNYYDILISGSERAVKIESAEGAQINYS